MRSEVWVRRTMNGDYELHVQIRQGYITMHYNEGGIDSPEEGMARALRIIRTTEGRFDEQ